MAGAHDHPDHMRLEQAFRECPGAWVAIDRRTGAVRMASQNPYELAAKIKAGQIGGVDIVRAPAEGEPEVVGFG